MTFLQAIVLGIIQGVTEFLPISSSAHLVLFPFLLNWDIPPEQTFPFDVLIQIGTLFSVIFYYREDLWIILQKMVKGVWNHHPFAEIEARIGWLTLLASIPAAVIGILTKPLVQSVFNNPSITAFFLFITAGLLVAGETLSNKSREIDEINWQDALWIGVLQILSIFPGVSRSGSTITGGMTRNMKRKPAGQFAFLLSIPIMLAAGVVGILDLIKLDHFSAFLPILAAGFLTAAIVGYLSIAWLIRYISHHSLLPFAGYCLFLGAGSLILLALNPATFSIAQDPQSASLTNQNVYQVGSSTDLEWLLPTMHDCQQKNGGFEILYIPHPAQFEETDSIQAFISYADKTSTSDYIYQIGVDELFIATHISQPLQALTPAEVNGIFSGHIKTWAEFLKSCPTCFSENPPVIQNTLKIWILLEDNLLSKTFMEKSLQNPIAPSAQIAPNAKFLKQIISSDADAIGYLPAGWLDGSIHGIAVKDDIGESIEIPITISLKNEPGQKLTQWILCLETELSDRKK